jgi:CheY-like chemotaxis protein
LLRRYNDRLHYILMDIELQGSILNGIELARLVNGQPIEQPLPDYAKDLPVISAPLLFVTAYSEKCDFMVFDLSSVVGVFHKPINSKKLLDMMAAVT